MCVCVCVCEQSVCILSVLGHIEHIPARFTYASIYVYLYIPTHFLEPLQHLCYVAHIARFHSHREVQHGFIGWCPRPPLLASLCVYVCICVCKCV